MSSRRKYDKEFKINAVKLFKKSELTIRQLEKDLAISNGNLGKWVKEFDRKPDDAFPGNGISTGLDLELTKLRRENKILREERDILKKVTGILSSPIK